MGTVLLCFVLSGMYDPMWSISHKSYIKFCCALFCLGYIILYVLYPIKYAHIVVVCFIWVVLIHVVYPIRYAYNVVLVCFSLFWLYYISLGSHVICLPISFMVASLALGQSYDCPSASEETMKDMGKIDQNQATTKHNRAQIMCLILWMHYICCDATLQYFKFSIWINVICIKKHSAIIVVIYFQQDGFAMFINQQLYQLQC